MKLQVYIQAYKVKNIYKQIKKEPTIIFLDERKISTQKYNIRNMVTDTLSWKQQLWQ